jgi:CheY-specific phosphatase CheX
MIEPGEVLPRIAWPRALSETAIEVFSMMVGATVTASADTALPVLSQMTGVVGIAGAVCATFSLRCSLQSAAKIASQMLGLPLDDPSIQSSACDAVGEICNIVAGYFKARIGLGDKCMLSVPTIVTGQNYRVHSGATGEHVKFPLIFEGEPVWIALDIRE